MRYHHQKSFDSAMESIGKPKLLNNRVGKSLIKSRTIEITRYNIMISNIKIFVFILRYYVEM